MGLGHGLVDRATSDTLIGPDWTLNLEITDVVNQDIKLVLSSFVICSSFLSSYLVSHIEFFSYFLFVLVCYV